MSAITRTQDYFAAKEEIKKNGLELKKGETDFALEMFHVLAEKLVRTLDLMYQKKHGLKHSVFHSHADVFFYGREGDAASQQHHDEELNAVLKEEWDWLTRELKKLATPLQPDPRTQHQMVLAHCVLHNFDAAIEWYNKASKPVTPTVQTLLVKSLNNVGRTEDAVRIFDSRHFSVERKPFIDQFVYAYTKRARYHLDNNNRKAAISDTQYAVAFCAEYLQFERHGRAIGMMDMLVNLCVDVDKLEVVYPLVKKCLDSSICLNWTSVQPVVNLLTPKAEQEAFYLVKQYLNITGTVPAKATMEKLLISLIQQKQLKEVLTLSIQMWKPYHISTFFVLFVPLLIQANQPTLLRDLLLDSAHCEYIHTAISHLSTLYPTNSTSATTATANRNFKPTPPSSPSTSSQAPHPSAASATTPPESRPRPDLSRYFPLQVYIESLEYLTQCIEVDMAECYKLFLKIKHYYPTTSTIPLNALMTGYIIRGQYQDAIAIFEGMPFIRYKAEPNVYSYYCAIHCYKQLHDAERVEHITSVAVQRFGEAFNTRDENILRNTKFKLKITR